MSLNNMFNYTPKVPYREGLRLTILCEFELTSVGVITFRDKYYPYNAIGCPIVIRTLTDMGSSDLTVRVFYVDKNSTARNVDITLSQYLRENEYFFLNTGDIITGWVTDITNVTFQSGGTVGDKFQIISVDGYIGRLYASIYSELDTRLTKEKEELEQRFLDLATEAGLIKWGDDLSVGRRTGWSLSKWKDILKIFRQYFYPTPQNIKTMLDNTDGITYNHVYELHDGPYYFGTLYDTWLLVASSEMPTSFEIQRVSGYGALTNEEIALLLSLVSPTSIHWEITYPIPQDTDEWSEAATNWAVDLGAVTKDSVVYNFGSASVKWTMTGDGNERYIEYDYGSALDLRSGAHSQLHFDIKTNQNIDLTRIRLYDSAGEWIQVDINETISTGDFTAKVYSMLNPDSDSAPGPFYANNFQIVRFYFNTVNTVAYEINLDHVRFEKNWIY